jgi:hypothetical protein
VLNSHHEDMWVSEGIAPRLLASALDGGERSASPFAHGTHWLGGWVGLGAGRDAVEVRKVSRPCRKSNPDSLVVQPVA